MKIVGTIVEYNPLHNGHVYALNEIRRLSQADVIVAVLSGDFTMRGDLSLWNKFEKTKYALQAGVDIVIELPFLYTVQNSDLFANYALLFLNQMGIQELWFGSESNNPAIFEDSYTKWVNEKNQEKIKAMIKNGNSYKEATSAIINLPSNDLLGFCYYKAIQENHFKISIHTIQRKGDFNSLVPESFASAYAIRSDLSLISTYCPPYVSSKDIRNEEALFSYLKFTILNLTTKELSEFFLVEEGLENKLHEIISFTSYKEFVHHLSSRRYTKSRIQRMLLYVLFQIKKMEVEAIKKGSPSYLRVMGYSKTGLSYIQTIKKRTKIYTNIKNGIHPVFDINLKISKILDMIYHSSEFKSEQSKPIEI